MRRFVFWILPFFLLLSSCNNKNEQEAQTTSENEVDAARNFIRAALDGKWGEARRFMLGDSTNTQLLDAYESNYQTHMNSADKRGYRESSITFYDTRRVNDSVSVINYSNSYKKQKDSLRVLRTNDTWVVDLKYSFLQTDTTHHAQ